MTVRGSDHFYQLPTTYLCFNRNSFANMLFDCIEAYRTFLDRVLFRIQVFILDSLVYHFDYPDTLSGWQQKWKPKIQ